MSARERPTATDRFCANCGLLESRHFWTSAQGVYLCPTATFEPTRDEDADPDQPGTDFTGGGSVSGNPKKR